MTRQSQRFTVSLNSGRYSLCHHCSFLCVVGSSSLTQFLRSDIVSTQWPIEFGWFGSSLVGSFDKGHRRSTCSMSIHPQQQQQQQGKAIVPTSIHPISHQGVQRQIIAKTPAEVEDLRWFIYRCLRFKRTIRRVPVPRAVGRFYDSGRTSGQNKVSFKKPEIWKTTRGRAQLQLAWGYCAFLCSYSHLH